PATAIPRGIRPRVSVTVPVLTLLGRSDEPGILDGYGPIDPATARRLAADAPSFTRILTHPETGAVLSVGRTSYRVPADLRRALATRDVTCRFPGCTRSARDSDIDHTVEWQHDGRTDSDNLAHLCRHHHRLRHTTTWRVHHRPGGILGWTSPTGRHHTTAPETPEPPERLFGGAPELRREDDFLPF
ncbi:HNH endonuclease signature motif containing protein, partial [Rathayibacter sp. Leaf296]|uniref:HNH endonuclease signature motif containing protein n=1 Tax=Rathayibacter sp. Leaf296 TaxID=1736327 RepID=UPI00138F5801